MNTEIKTDLEQYSITIIKPDAFRDYLSQMIVSDIEASGLQIIYRKEMKLDEQQAKYVYLEHQNSDRYPFMTQSLLLRNRNGEQFPAMLLVLKSESENALNINQKAKGRADQSGIRAKYRMYYWHELEKLGYYGDELNLMLARNRLHVPDDHKRLVEILSLLLQKNDLDKINETDHALVQRVRHYQDSLPKSIIVLQG